MADSTLNRFVAKGTNADRLAFTPDAPTPASGPDQGYFFYETDTGDTYTWDGSAWDKVNNSSGSVTTSGSPSNGNLTKFSGAGTITNADLSGDVTTSGTVATTIANNAVTTAKINDGAVTLAKIVDATATKRVIGRNTAASGDFEEVTIEQLFSWISGTPAQGDVFYRDGSGVARLAAGTSGQFLKTQGAGANPVWASVSSSAWALAGTGQTATGVYDFAVDGAKANIDFIGLGSFNELLIIARGVSYSVSGQRGVQVSVDNGSTWFTSSGDYVAVSGAGVEAADTTINLHATASASARSATLHIENTKGAVKNTRRLGTNTDVLFVGSTSDINAIRFNNSGGGNSGAGTVRVYAR